MAVQVKNPPKISKRLFSVEEYHRLGEVGILSADDRVELINGEIIEMSPIGSRHAACVRAIQEFLQEKLGRKAQVSVQNPIQLDDRAEPQPDIALLKPRKDRYARAHPKPADIILVIEVSDTTLENDRSVKLPLYAHAEIPETWLIDLNQEAIEQFSDPRNGEYRTSHRFRRGDAITAVSVSGLTLAVNEILGE
jgi:Uma2 family endonuclease